MKVQTGNTLLEMKIMRGVPRYKDVEEVLRINMTEKQRTIFLVIDEWWKRHGYGPSIDDIMYQTGDKGRGNVHRVVKKLCDLGICKRVSKSARSVRPSYLSMRNI